MENRNKKRLSILKKPNQDDPPTPSGTKSNRRISFSGRKSVKEFMAGEDKATIWGTSYEEEDDGIHAGNQNPSKTHDIIATNSSVMISNPTIGMQLRNKKVISLNSSKLPPALDKENIMIVPENENDTIDLTQSIQFGALAYDNRTFNATVDITLNSFELNNCKFSSNAQARLQMATNAVKPNEPDLDISPEFYSSLTNIKEKEREYAIQKRRCNENKSPVSDQVQNDAAVAEQQSKVGNQKQTLMFNNTEAMDESFNTRGELQRFAPAQSSKKSRKETLIFNVGKDSEMQIETELVTTADSKSTLNKDNSSTSTLSRHVNRQTLILDQRCDIDETLTDHIPQNQRAVTENTLQVNRKTIIFDRGNELEQSQVFDSKSLQDKNILPVPQVTRQTIFFHQKPDLDISIARNSEMNAEILTDLIYQNQQAITENTLPVNRKTIIFDRGNELEQSQVFISKSIQDKNMPNPQATRQTIFFQEQPDLDLSNARNSEHQSITGNYIDQKKVRPTLLFENCDLDQSVGNGTNHQIYNHPAKSPHQSRSLALDRIEPEKDTDNNISIFERIQKKRWNENCRDMNLSTGHPHENQRRTIFFDKTEKLNEDHSQSISEFLQPTAKNRRTVVFRKEGNDLDLTMGNTNTSANVLCSFQEKSKQRRTVVFEKPESMDETQIENSPADCIKGAVTSNDVTSVPIEKIPAQRKTLIFNITEFLDQSGCDAIPHADTNSNERILTEEKTKSSKQNRQTILFSKSSDLDLTLPSNKANVSTRNVNTANQKRTVIFDNPESLDDTANGLGNLQAVASASSAYKAQQLSNILNVNDDSDMELENAEVIENTNQNVNNDPSTTPTLSWPSLKSQNPVEKQFIKNRQTLIFDQKCDIDESLSDFQKSERYAKLHETGPVRKTKIFDQSHNLDESQLLAPTSLSYNIINDKVVLRTVQSFLPTTQATRQTIVFNEGNNLDLTMETDSPPFKNDGIKNPVVSPVQRKTLIFNKTAALDQSLCDSTALQESNQSSKKCRQTILFSKAVDLDLTMPNNQTSDVRTAKIANQRRTVIFDDPELLDESSTQIGQPIASAQRTSCQPSFIINRNDDCNMEVEANLMDMHDNSHKESQHTRKSPNPVAQQSIKNRQTLTFDQRCDMDETLPDFEIPEKLPAISEISQVKQSASDRKTKIFNQSHGIDETQCSKSILLETSTKPNATTRQTISFNQGNDLDLTVETDTKKSENHSQSILSNSIKRMKYRQGILFKKNSDVDLTLECDRVLKQVDENINHQSRSTIFDRYKAERTTENDLSLLERTRKNHSIENHENFDLSTGRRQHESQRQTIIFDKNDKLEEDHLQLVRDNHDKSMQKNRKTVLFGSESNDLDLTMETSIASKNYSLQHNAQPRRTVIFEKPENLEETNISENFLHNRTGNRAKNIPSTENKSVGIEEYGKINEEDSNSQQFPLKINSDDKNQSHRNTSTRKNRQTIDNVIEIDETIIDCPIQSVCLPEISQNNRTQLHEVSSRSVIDISGIENLDYTTRNCETLLSTTPITKLSHNNFENNSLTADINSQMFRKLTQDSIYLSKTAHCAAVASGGGSLHTTTSSSTFSPNTTEALCNIDPSKITGTAYKRSLVKNFDLDDTTYGFKQFRRDYGELTIGMGSNSSHDDIEKTQLSLIEAFSINTTVDSPQVVVCDKSELAPCNASQLLLNDSGAQNKDTRVNLKDITKIDDFCRKCKNCRRSINFNGNDTTITGFVLEENMESLTLNFDCLNKLRGKPRIIDVLNGIADRRDERDRRYSDSFNSISDESITFPAVPSIDFLLKNYAEGYMQQLKEEEKSNCCTGTLCPLIPTFEFLFKNKLETEKCDWHFNDLHLPAGLFECRHKTIRSIRLLIHFTAQELFKPKASRLNFNKITLSRCPIIKNLTPFDRIVQNDIFSKLPCDLTVMCNSNNELFDFLNGIHTICFNSHELGKSLLKIATIHQGFLRSSESGKCIIKKTVRDPMAAKLGIKKLQIHIREIEKLAWRDIEVPDSCRFSDHIESLPIGLDFLATFLNNPVKYFK